jgi:small subunit ribosomal protein S6e
MFKFNVSEKSGKTFHLESEAEQIIGKNLKDKIEGKIVSSDLEGYEFEINGMSDKAGLTAMENVEGIGLKRILLTYGKAMHRRSRREGKKKRSNFTPRGLRLRKTVRGRIVSPEIVQINLKVVKEGNKKLADIFPEQNQPKPKAEAKPAEAVAQ